MHKVLLQTGLPLDEEQYGVWVRFLSARMLRGPAMMEHIKAVGRTTMLEVLEANPDQFEAVGGDVAESTLPEWLGAQDQSYIDSFGTRAFPLLIQQPLFTDRFLGGKTWMRIRVGSARHDLLIGDHPLIQDGPLDADHAFLMPIAPRVLFAVVSSPAVARRIKAIPPGQLVQRVNMMTIERAQTYVFSTNSSQATYVKKYLKASD